MTRPWPMSLRRRPASFLNARRRRAPFSSTFPPRIFMCHGPRIPDFKVRLSSENVETRWCSLTGWSGRSHRLLKTPALRITPFSSSLRTMDRFTMMDTRMGPRCVSLPRSPTRGTMAPAATAGENTRFMRGERECLFFFAGPRGSSPGCPQPL